MHGGTALVYDGDGNRVSETEGSTATKYLVDDLNPTGYVQVLDELVSGSVARTYAYGLQRISENQLVGSTWTPDFYGYDGHGNVRFLANAAGTVTDTYTFDAFGVQVASTGTTSNPYLYSAERFDNSLSLYHLGARYYNALTGRFETMDPATGKFTDPATLHKYVYTQNNPVNAIDPLGLGSAGEYAALEEGDIGTYDYLSTRPAGSGLEAHHIIPQRFACVYGAASGEMMAILLRPEIHAFYTKAWVGCEADIESIAEEALDIYAGEPDILQVVNDWIATMKEFGLL